MSTTPTQSSNPVYVSLEFTPNPNTLKYSVNRTLVPKSAVNVVRKEDALKKSPLAVKLLDVPGICGVMIGRDFVTVTKTEEGDWDVVHRSASTIVEQHLTQNEPVLTVEAMEATASPAGTNEIEKKIMEVLDQEIRPAVAMDGGDIVFDRYEAGVVYLQMQGSCAGCPSSTATLKMGVETRLKEVIPDVIEVVSV